MEGLLLKQGTLHNLLYLEDNKPDPMVVILFVLSHWHSNMQPGMEADNEYHPSFVKILSLLMNTHQPLFQVDNEYHPIIVVMSNGTKEQEKLEKKWMKLS